MLEVKGLSAGYGGIDVVSGICFEVGDEGVTGLIGANGAGKSTILRCLSRLMDISSGEMWFQGMRIDCLLPSEIVRMGIIHVPERRGLFPNMSVLENLLVGAYLLNGIETKQRVKEVFTLFPILEERRHQIAGTMSGGEQQMLAIGRGLAARPKLLILDEPTVGLSPIMIREVIRKVLEITKRGVSILLVEQNARLALAFSRWVYVLQIGKIVLEGDPKELQNSEYIRKAYLGR
ncbi:MAG: ABC transporter ATP-binding protein [Dehalococcoidia bacterium]